MAAQHSPLPWQCSHRQDADGMYSTQVFDPSGQTIATIAWAPRPEVDGVIGTYREANAAFIVRACNTHDDLLAALKALDAFQVDYERKTYDTAPGNTLWAGKLMEVVTAARAAIAKAEAE